MKRTAYAHWEGSLKKGKGTLTTQSEALRKARFSFKSRFDKGETGTSPEELLAATHAGCFTMTVCSILTKKGFDAEILDTEATVTIETSGIASIHLSIKGSVKDINTDDFIAATKEAEKNCLISKVLKIPVSTDAGLAE